MPCSCAWWRRPVEPPRPTERLTSWGPGGEDELKTMLICAACGYANRAGARFCSGCGGGFAVLGPACGAQLAERARFCDACGAEVSSPPAHPESRKVVT